MPEPSTMPDDWHKDKFDGFHGRISVTGPFQPEPDRYHLYIGLFCPFAHRANLAVELKGIRQHAKLGVSIVRPYSSEKSERGLLFNVASHEPDFENNYPGSTQDKVFGSVALQDVYLKADPLFQGRASVPMLWDRKLGTVVNNESADLLRQLQTVFDLILPKQLQMINLYPKSLQDEIDSISHWIHQDLNMGVYQVGFASSQTSYEEKLVLLFSALRRAEKLVASHNGPFVLGEELTILDIQLFSTIVRFDPAYVQAFRCNLGDIRHDYPALNDWLKTLFWNSTGRTAPFRETTDFAHIKSFYFMNFPELYPRRIIPVGPRPPVEASPWGSSEESASQDQS